MSRAKTAESPAEGAAEATTDAVDANTEGGIGAGEPTAEGAPATTDQPAEATPAATEAETGQTEAEPTAEAAAEQTEAEPAPAKPRPAWRRLPALLLAAALVLAGAGVWFTLEARSAASTPAAANLALTDVAATADVTSAVSLAVNRIFSYSYDRTDVTEKAAAAVLRGAAKDSYDKLFAEVRRKAPEQKLVLTSRVSAIAVQELENGHARLLVFLDQSAVRADNNATDSAAAQLSVTAEHTRDGWVITELDPR
jgi:Mce-associated membrane protein